jgi:L-rhamnose-H+ transport protein
MNAGFLPGTMLTVVAGIIIGACLLPLKWAKQWKWENFWVLYSLVSLLVVPVGLCFAVVPKPLHLYMSLSPREVLVPFVLGGLWGVAQLGAGIGMYRIGMGLSSSILNGICAASGTLIPLSVQHPELLPRPSGILILAGTAVMAVGLVFCGWAGRQREIATGQLKAVGSGYRGILVLVIVSGFLASLLNIALAFGGNIIDMARKAGAAPAWAPFAVWPLALAGGLLINLGYSFYLLTRNKTWGNFRGGPREVFNPVLAGVMWMGSIAIYTTATTFLGILGVSVGWSLFQIFMILSANLAGVFTGEWRRTEGRVRKANMIGVAVLFVAIILIGAANAFAP